MNNPVKRFAKLLEEDPRYGPEAYQFVREALTYAQNVLRMGDSALAVNAEEMERHLTGQQLCEAIRQYAIDQYGLMAQVVLKKWGITATDHFGDIVYNLIDIGMMKKSRDDRKEDFHGVFDFDEAFQERFQITPPKDPS